MSAALPADIAVRVQAILGWRPVVAKRVTGGYTAASRCIVSDGDRRSAFLKLGVTPLSAEMVRREAAAYAALGSQDFLPLIYGADLAEGEAPLLLSEDLSTAHWPPPWTPAALDAVRASITAMHATPPPPGMQDFAERHGGWSDGWDAVAADPKPFLALGLMPAAALERVLPALLAAERQADPAGKNLCHWDLRSDNLCIAPDGRAKIIDWTEACHSDPRHDLGFFAPSLAFEGGPLPEDLMGAPAPEIAAWVSGFFAARAGLPVIPDAPFVRRVQHEQLTTALPWALRELGLG